MKALNPSNSVPYKSVAYVANDQYDDWERIEEIIDIPDNDDMSPAAYLDDMDDTIYGTKRNTNNYYENTVQSYPDKELIKSMTEQFKKVNPPITVPKQSHMVGRAHKLHDEDPSPESKNNEFVEWSKQNRFTLSEKRMIAKGHHDIIQTMIKLLNKQKDNSYEYVLLSTALEITGKFYTLYLIIFDCHDVSYLKIVIS